MGTLTSLSGHPRYRRRRRLSDLLPGRRRRPTNLLTCRRHSDPPCAITICPGRYVPAGGCATLARAAGDLEAGSVPDAPGRRLRLVSPPAPASRPVRRAGPRLVGVALVTAAVASAGVVLADRPAAGHPTPPRRSVTAPTAGYQWPLPGSPRVTRSFDPPPEPWSAGHRGVDLAGVGGEPVLAAGSGTVAFAGQVAGVGVVSIDHAGGLRTTYQPLVPSVRAGQHVVAGQRIGTLQTGHPGCPVAACLHWGLRHGDDYLDPLILLGFGRVRLLPLGRPVHALGWAWR